MARFLKAIIFFVLINYTPQLVLAAMDDDPLLYNIMVGEMETDDSSSDLFSWDVQTWLGKNINKLWLKTEGERESGETEYVEIQALYSRAISSFWNFQAGIRHDTLPKLEQNWGVIGLQGLAPYWFEIDTALFIGESGNTALRFNVEYELLFTQKLILTPELEINLYGQDIPEVSLGAGLSDATLGLRLRYEIRREFAPYIGIEWSKIYAGSADFVRRSGAAVSDTKVVAGLRLWF